MVIRLLHSLSWPGRRASWRLPLVPALLLLLAGCGGDDFQRYSGNTMGTYYQVTAQCPRGDVAAAIEDELRLVNAEMSTYLADSTLSEFNRQPPGDWFPVPATLAEVIDTARMLSDQSGGAFDVTIGPLVNLWGFGPPEIDEPPAPEAVAEALERVGYQKLEVRLEPPALRKQADVYVDLSAIAKGHGVGRVMDRLAAAGCRSMLVDIGGDAAARGVSPANHAWRIGVEVPDPSRYGTVQRIVRLSESSIATSGDYRNFVEVDGQRFSHTVDPSTGYPVQHTVASVSVIHPSPTWADGYATLLNVLGADEGMAFAQAHGLAAMFIVRGEKGFEERYTPWFESALLE
jgi:FAD:protein FMN transferase